MNNYFRKVSLLTIVCLVLCIKGQTQIISDSLFKSITQHDDVIILDEKTSVSYAGKKADLMFVYINKEISYLVNSEEGIKEIKRIALPETFDPSFIQHSSTAQKTKRLYEKIIIDLVETSVKSPEKTEILNKYTLLKNENVCLKDDDKYGSVTEYSIDIDDIVKGSIVKIKYILHFPFDYNWKQLLSTRVFFHSKYPKMKYELNWLYPRKLEVDTFFYRSVPVVDTINNNVNLNWKFKNLPGCIDEPGSYPYVDLPWFIFSPKPNIFLYYYYNTNEVDYAPLWYLLSYRKVYKFLNAKLNVESGLKTSDQLAFNSLAENFKKTEENDSTGFFSLSNFQKWMVNDIKFNKDNDYYKVLVKESLDKSGLDLQDMELKDHNRYEAYARMICSLGLDYYVSYPVDKRYGEISNHYFTTIYDCDMLMVSVLKNKIFTFSYPVSDLSHYYLEELPFYFENIKTQIIPASYYGGYKEDLNKQYMIINTPASNLTDNKRRTNSFVNVKVDENVCDFKTKVDLSGQYSTLTRNIYKNLPVDSSINPLYFEKTYAINNSVKVLKETFNQASFQYPYNSVVNLEYTVSNGLAKKDSLLTINITPWFKHIYYPALLNTYRFTDFYADFLGTDTYMYILKFDKPVLLLSPAEEIKIDNGFGNYTYKVDQIDEYQIKLTSFFSVNSNKIKANNIIQVKDIYSGILSNKELVLKVK